VRRLTLLCLAAVAVVAAGCVSHERAAAYRGAALAVGRGGAAGPGAAVPGDGVVLTLGRTRGTVRTRVTRGEGLSIELDAARLRPGAVLVLPRDARRVLAWTLRGPVLQVAEDVEGALEIVAVTDGEVQARATVRSAVAGLALDARDVPLAFRVEPAPAPPPGRAVPDAARQLLLVIADGWDTPEARAHRYERDAGGSWRAVGRPLRAAVGRSGLGWGLGLHPDPPAPGPVKREGDGRAPAGAFGFGIAFGDGTVPEPAGRPFLLARPESVCVDDPTSPAYNTIGRVDRERPPRSAEAMFRDDGAYRIGVVIEHNPPPAVAGRGSCLFLHVWRRPGEPTSGGTAFAPGDAEALVSWLGPAAVLVQLPRAEYDRVAPEWGLPALPDAR
jgi:L,D-peptidoglycan transpeptidase YkuD (ErfK/YbiS/YcfS/YnhG family)